jgi:predicted peptidase
MSLKNILLILCIPAFSISALEPWQERFERFDYEDGKGNTMPYNVMKPIGFDSTKKYPLVLGLHGMGGDGTDGRVHTGAEVATWAQDDVQAKYPCFVLAPQCPANSDVQTHWGDVKWSKVPAPMSETPTIYGSIALAALELVQEKYPNIDRNRTYICGGSMGGVGTFYLSQHRPDLFAAGIAVSGGGDDKSADSLLGMAFMAVHGVDDGIVPVEGARAVFKALEDLGQKYLLVQNPKSDAAADYMPHKYVFIENPQGKTGHGISSKTFPMPQVQAWLFSKTKDNATHAAPGSAMLRLATGNSAPAKAAFISPAGLFGGRHSSMRMYSLDGSLLTKGNSATAPTGNVPSGINVYAPVRNR